LEEGKVSRKRRTFTKEGLNYQVIRRLRGGKNLIGPIKEKGPRVSNPGI